MVERRTKRWNLVAVLGVMVGILAPALVFEPTVAGAMPETITVSDGESIQAALDGAPEGSTVVVEAGVYEEQVRVRTDGITLKGEKGAIVRPGNAQSTNDCSWFGLGTAICIGKQYVENAHPRWPGEPLPTEMIDGVTVTGFTIEGPSGFGIDAALATNVKITRNVISGTVGAGVSIGGSSNFTISRNRIDNEGVANFTPQLFVGASSNGKVSRNILSNGAGNNAASMDDVRNVRFDRNTITGACGGLLISSVSGDAKLLRKLTIQRNVIRENNASCAAAGIDGTIGGFGILVIAGSKITIRSNTVVDNVVAEDTITPAAVIVAPSPGADVAPKNVVIANNTIRGNSVGSQSTDLLAAIEGKLRVKNNDCDVSLPNADWCTGE